MQCACTTRFWKCRHPVRSGQKIGKPNISEVFESSIDKLIIEAKKKLTHELINGNFENIIFLKIHNIGVAMNNSISESKNRHFQAKI